MDGNQFNDNAGALDVNIINSRYAITSPFEVKVSHSFSAANDTIYAQVVIKAAQNYTGTNLVAQIAVTERDIFGYTSPNGESHYEGVLRKMLPSAAGTPLPASWNNGDSTVLNYSWYITTASLSSPVYYQLSVIAFVQENSNKEVLQAGYSRAQVPMDPKAKSMSGLLDVNCSGSITPSFTIFNNGITDITSLDVEYKIDNNTPQTYSWTGLLTSFSSTTITLPSIAAPGSGSHSLTLTVVNPNGGVTDNNLLNNSKTAYFGIPTSAVASNVAEDFTTTTFPPANWMRVDQNGNNIGWSRSTASTVGSGSAKIDFYSSMTGHIDNLYVYPVDMSSASAANMTFDVAHRQYSADYVDQLNVQVSTDCGVTWNTEWSKSGTALSTVTGFQTSAFTPTATQWRAEQVNLNQYAGSNNVLIRFNAVSGYGNNAYVDNVNVTLITGIDEFTNGETALYPNPSKGLVYIRTVADPTNYQIMYTMEANVITTDLSALNNGVYFVTIQTKQGIERKKIVLSR